MKEGLIKTAVILPICTTFVIGPAMIIMDLCGFPESNYASTYEKNYAYRYYVVSEKLNRAADYMDNFLVVNEDDVFMVINNCDENA